MRWIVLAVFFFSGLSSLVLENLWVRMLTLVFGGSTLAVVTVLTSFMGGLALGSHWAGRYADSIRRPLLTYGLLEIGIGLYALLVPWIFSLFPSLYGLLSEGVPFYVTALYRFLLCLGGLLLPTTLMGATLPVLSRYLARERHRLGMDVGLLYTANTTGAVMGAFTGGFVLLPLLGNQATLFLTAGLDILLGAMMIALGLSRWGTLERPLKGKRSLLQRAHSKEAPDEPTPEEEEFAAAEEEPRAVSAFDRFWEKHQPTLLVVSFGLTGALAMICQVIWSRALAMVIGSSSYAFTLILTLFLVGLALGAGIGSRIVDRVKEPAGALSDVLLTVAITVTAGLLLMDRLPEMFGVFATWIKDSSPLALFGVKSAVAAIPILIPTIFMGMIFPLMVGASAPKKERIGSLVGRLYAVNTLGSIVGSFSAGFVVIPLVGLRGGLILSVVLYLLVALLLIIEPSQRRLRLMRSIAEPNGEGLSRWGYFQGMRRLLLVATVGACVLFAVIVAPSWHPGRMGLGMFRISLLRYERTAAARNDVLFYKEGVSCTVSVERSGNNLALKVNGKTDASNFGDRGTQVGVAALPLWIHGNPRDVAIVGWGSGMTVGAALQFPLRSLISVELEPAVVAASRFFERWNYHPLKDRRLKLLYNDGRNFLATTHRTFDVIISEPSNPWISGVASLFTVEYFQMTKRRLRPGGLLCQWVQLYELSLRNILSILRSVRQVYPYVYLFELEDNGYDTILLASMSPISMDLKRLQKMMSQKRYSHLLKVMELENAFGWTTRFMLGQKEIDGLLANKKVPLNTDDHTILEFSAPIDLLSYSDSTGGETFRKKVVEVGRRFRRYMSHPRQRTRAGRGWFLAQAARAHLLYGSVERGRKLSKEARRLAPKDPQVQEIYKLARLISGAESEPTLDVSLPPEPFASPWKVLEKGRRFYKKDKYKKCLKKLNPLKKKKFFAEQYPELWYYLGACSYYDGKYKESFYLFRRYWRETKSPASKPASRPVRRAASRPVSRPVRATASRPVSRPASRGASSPTSHPASRGASSPTSHPASRGASPPTRCPVRRAASRPASRPVQRPPPSPTSCPARRASSHPASRPLPQKARR